MTRAAFVVLATAIAVVCAATIDAQSRRAVPRTPIRTIQPADVTCSAPLGTGTATGRQFCDVPAGREAKEGIIVRLPPRRGIATLTFDLHNRHTYSAEEERSGQAYRRYTATIGVLTLDNTLLSRFVVRNEFRRASDLFDRVSGGSGVGGVKAVAPTGVESVAIDIPDAIDAVSILGEKELVVAAQAGPPEIHMAPGRPVAVVSQIMVEYTPAPKPAKKPVRRRSSRG